MEFFKSLPLFEEELRILDELIGIEHHEEEERERIPLKDEEISKKEEIKEMLTREEFGELSRVQVEIDQRFGKLESKQGDARRDKETFIEEKKTDEKEVLLPNIRVVGIQKIQRSSRRILEIST